MPVKEPNYRGTSHLYSDDRSNTQEKNFSAEFVSNMGKTESEHRTLMNVEDEPLMEHANPDTTLS